jgi:hypothetical protein
MRKLKEPEEILKIRENLEKRINILDKFDKYPWIYFIILWIYFIIYVLLILLFLYFYMK